jgi:hypothetical protein
VSKWGTARWGTDRWPALTVAEQLQQPPDVAHGAPIGIGDWRISYEVLLPADETSLWGVAVWGTATWNLMAWQDITPWVRGAEWTRGSDEPYGRPRVGELALTLSSGDERFSPWNPTPPDGAASFFGPGTILRVGCRSATDTRAGGWLPQITTIVDTWDEQIVAANVADRIVQVRAFETLRDLAQIDDNALPGLVGGGENPLARFPRLLDESDWRYGLKIEAQNVLSGAYALQSTDMAANRLAECYLTADSCDVQFRTDRTGAALVTNVEYITTIGPADESILPLIAFSTDGTFPAFGLDWSRWVDVNGRRYVAYRPDTFESGNTDDNVVNDARLARVGGSQQAFQQLASIARHGRRSLVRNDLLLNADPPIALIAQYTTIRRALNTLRVKAVTVPTSDMPDEDALVVLAADIQSFVNVFSPDKLIPSTPNRAVIVGFVSGVTHRWTYRNQSASTWETTFSIDTRTVYNLPSAQLPATP